MAERQTRPSQMPPPPKVAEVAPVVPAFEPPPVHSDAEGPKVSVPEFFEPEEHKVKFQKGEGTKVEISVPKDTRVEVIATRAGFIYNIRKSEGDRFHISDMSQFGDWMILADPLAEGKRQDEIRLAKLKARQEQSPR